MRRCALMLGIGALILTAVPQTLFASTTALPSSTASDVGGEVVPIVSQTATEAAVRTYFADIPVMVEIARCESKFRQFNDDGTVLRGGYGNQMLGIFQLYDRIHQAEAASLGYNIHTIEGNMGYARYLYEKSGTTPWNSSAHCWANSASTFGSESDTELLARISELLALIEKLQTLLATQQLAQR